MRTGDKTFSELRRELDFLDRGGYRILRSWRPPLLWPSLAGFEVATEVFEDSPICTKQSNHSCPNTCALVSFVPTEYRDEAVPCRHIPLNAAGETLHTMYSTATMEEIEAAIRIRLLRVIGRAEPASLQEETRAA